MIAILTYILLLHTLWALFAVTIDIKLHGWRNSKSISCFLMNLVGCPICIVWGIVRTMLKKEINI